ncbi:MAG: radical SAM protein [Planctomycetota bacterium]
MAREFNGNGNGRNGFYRRKVFLRKIWYWLRGSWRDVRISRSVTSLLGPQYVRSRDYIEIDITYDCNLQCVNCNRSVRQAPDPLHIGLENIRAFVEESISRRKRWKRIRVLGGEPTLHPQFFEIINELSRYRKWYPPCVIEVLTNGFGETVQAQLKRLPAFVWIVNSSKTGDFQPKFRPFNLAPIDDPKYKNADYSNGCSIMIDCGMGLTPLGYYPCAVAGGIDRIIGGKLGYNSIPTDDDDMLGPASQLCKLCGRFLDGHLVPENLRPDLAEAEVSPTWLRLYTDWWKANKPDCPEPLTEIFNGKHGNGGNGARARHHHMC